MTDLATNTQISVLARLLDTDPIELTSLARLGAADISTLTASISDSLFDSLAATFVRLSKFAPMVPDSLAASVALKAIPAEVGGRAGGALGFNHPHRVAGILAGLTPTYMAEAAPYVDPRTIPSFIPKLPADLLVSVAHQLLARGDYLTTARFMEHSTRAQIQHYDSSIDCDTALIRTLAHISVEERLSTVIAAISPARLIRLFTHVGAADPETVLAAKLVLTRLSPETAAPLAACLLCPEHRDRIIAIATAHEAEAELHHLMVLEARKDGRTPGSEA